MNTLFSNFPFLRYCILLILGILGYLFFKIDILHINAILAILISTYFIIYLLKKGKSRTLLGIVGNLLIVGFGYFISFYSNPTHNSNHISYINKYDYYEARISSLVEEKPKSWKATADILGIILGDDFKISTGKVLLYFDKDHVPKPKYGELMLIKGMPSLVDSPKNPDEFDYKKYLSYQGIYNQHYLRDTSFTSIKRNEPISFNKFAYSINNYCDSVFTHYISGKTDLAVINAMVLGLRDDIDNDLIQAYSAAGAIHVLSVSGLHVGVIYIILVWFFGFFKKFGNFGKWTFLVVILMVLWLYAAITGFSSPVLRSTFMFSLILIAQNHNRQDNSYNTLSISAFCLLLFNPFLITNVGFLLSYLAVFGMIQIQPLLNPLIVIDKRKNLLNWVLDRLWKVSTVAIAAQIATLPITIYFFHQFPNYFLLANPVVILLSSVVLVGGLAFLVLQLVFSFFNLVIVNNILAHILEILVKSLNETVLFTEKLPGAISKYLDFSIIEVLILYGLIFSILALLQTKRYIWVKLSVLCISLLIGFSITDFLNTKNQNILCIHAIPKATAISIITKNKVSLVADVELLNDRKNINFRLNSFWSKRGITKVEKIKLPNMSSIYIWKGKTFLFLNNRILKTNEVNALLSVDYLIIRNKKLRYFTDIKDKIKFKTLIIDSHLSNFYASRFHQEAAQDGVLAYSLLKDGALIL